MMGAIRKTKSFLIMCLLTFSTLSVVAPRNRSTDGQLLAGAELTGNVFDWGKDIDYDSRYDYLVVGVEINVSSAGAYQVQIGYLQDPSNNSRNSWWYGYDYSYGYWDVGFHVVNFSFFGPKIFADGFNISAVTQINLYGPSSDYLERAPLSHVYHYNEFDCWALLTGVIHDQGLDTDGDGLFNKLQLNVEVNVTDRASYEVSVSTYVGGFSGTYIYSSATSFLEPGLQTVNVSLDGAKIYSSHGNLSSIDNVYLSVFEEGGRYYSIHYAFSRLLGKTYNYREFDAMAFFTGTVSNIGVDDDGDGLFDYMGISVEVNVTDAGGYSIILQDLTDSFNSSNAIYDYESYPSDFEIGLHVINFTVYGPRIYSSHTNPIYIRSLRLMAGFGRDEILVDEKKMVHLPTLYDYVEFESHAFLTGRIYDHGVDTDADGLFDYLEVGVEVNVTESGDYEVSIRGLIGRKGDYTEQLYLGQWVGSALDVGVHMINVSISGLMLAYNRFNPFNVTDVELTQLSPYCQLNSFQMAALSTQYNYTQFNTPFNDMQIQFTVYPNATLEVSGSSNHTRIYPTYSRDYQPSVNATFLLSTQGDATAGSLNGTMEVPRYPYSQLRQFPFNSTNASFNAGYNNGMLNAQLNASVFMPVAGRTTYPVNSSDFSFLATYSNRMLNVDLSGQTTLPSIVSSTLPFNVSDVTVLADYGDNKVSGNITFHTVSGFPLGDVIAHFSGNKTEIEVTGYVNVMYGSYFGVVLNETSLEEMLSNLNSTFPGQGSQSLYNQTQGMIECTRLSTSKTPISGPPEGARVDFNATIHGNFTDIVGETVTHMFFGYWAPEETHRIVNAAINAAFSSVDHASLTLNYYHGSKIGTIDLTLASSIPAFWDNAVQLVLPIVPSENRTMAEAWLKIGNSTAFAVEDARIDASYSSSLQQLDFSASLTANVSRFKGEVLPILPDAVPPQLRDLVESCTNTSECTLDSLNVTAKYVNGVADFDVQWLLIGNFTAQLNRVKDRYVEYLNLASPWMINWQIRLLNSTNVDISKFRADVRQGRDWETMTFEGLLLHPTSDEIDRVRFKLLSWLETMSDPWIPPTQFEKLKVAVKGGFDGTNTVLLGSLGTTPGADTVSLDYKSMIWQNVTMTSLKHLLFKVAYQGVVNYASRTFYVPVFTNSTVSNFGFDAETKSISFKVAGDTGAGFCNVTIPKELLYALPSEWIVSINGTALTLGSLNVTENAEYAFIYVPYSHSTHTIRIQGTTGITEFPSSMLPIALVILSLATAIAAIKYRRRLNRLKTKYGTIIRAFAGTFHR